MNSSPSINEVNNLQTFNEDGVYILTSDGKWTNQEVLIAMYQDDDNDNFYTRIDPEEMLPDGYLD